VRKSPASEDVITGVEGSTALEAVAKQDTADWKDLVRTVVNCRVCEAVIAVQMLVRLIAK
jgi:hypothetical protein